MQHCYIEIDNFIHGIWIISQKLHTYAKLMYVCEVHEVEGHFVHDLGARSQHEGDKENYEEGSGENETNMDLQNFGNDENWATG